MARVISIPAYILVEVDDEFDMDDAHAEETLMDYVLDDFGKYPNVDYRTLAYDDAQDLGEA